MADAELDDLQALPPHLQKKLDEAKAAKDGDEQSEDGSDGETEPPQEDYGSEEEEEEDPIPPPKKAKKQLVSAGQSHRR